MAILTSGDEEHRRDEENEMHLKKLAMIDRIGFAFFCFCVGMSVAFVFSLFSLIDK